MTHNDGLDDAMALAEGAVGGPADVLLRRIADRIGARAGATAVYGQPVSVDGVTVIPVARSRWGFGGGAGEGGDDEDSGSGAGGGGGAAASPVGYIEISDGVARFVPISDPAKYWPLVVAGGLVAWLVLRGLKGLFR